MLSATSHRTLHGVARRLDPLGSQHIMTVRVDTLDAILTGSPSRVLPLVRMLSAAASWTVWRHGGRSARRSS